MEGLHYPLASEVFQSTLPRRERRFDERNSHYAELFQSTLP